MRPMLSLYVVGMALVGLVCAAGSVAAAPADGPDQVKLDKLASLFDAVNFNHAAHVEIAEDCATCHHHTTGDRAGKGRCERCHAQTQYRKTTAVACRDCHVADPFTAAQLERKADDRFQYHVDKPGLKAAYHWSCLGCHEESGGPTGCEDCHSRTVAGEEFYRSGKFAPKASASTAHH